MSIASDVRNSVACSAEPAAECQSAAVLFVVQNGTAEMREQRDRSFDRKRWPAMLIRIFGAPFNNKS